MPPLSSVAAQLLADLEQCLEQLTDTQYAQPQAVYGGSSIGQHTRHIIEFYQCLLQCGHTLDYDLRRRDLALETHRASAVAAIRQVAGTLPAAEQTDRPLQLAYGYQAANEGAENKEQLPSSMRRELLYNIEHTIHHLALIRIGVGIIAPHVELPAHFGVAPSTLRYRQHTPSTTHGACVQ